MSEHRDKIVERIAHSVDQPEPRARVRIPGGVAPPATTTSEFAKLNTSIHDLLMQIRYDLTAAQGKLTEALRQVAALPNQGKTETAHDRAIARARQLIQAGEWDNLTPQQFDVELDDLGIAHADRGPLERQHAARMTVPVPGGNAKAGSSDG